MAETLAAQLSGLAAETTITHGLLRHEAYLRRLRRSDILLLPYHPRRYALRASGMFSEAMGLGLVTVVPAETWMADMLTAGWGAGATFGGFSAAAIVKAVLNASDMLATLLTAAAQKQEAWRRTHSADALLDVILRGFGLA
jgi:hypothetical protein